MHVAGAVIVAVHVNVNGPVAHPVHVIEFDNGHGSVPVHVHGHDHDHGLDHGHDHGAGHGHV